MTDGGTFDRYLAGQRPANYRTASGIELDAAYTAGRDSEGEQPGIYPFTRGVHPEMYRTRLWTRRRQSGYGTPGTNKAAVLEGVIRAVAGDRRNAFDRPIAANTGVPQFRTCPGIRPSNLPGRHPRNRRPFCP